jgi:oligopeptide transport system ATP-binding protein
VAVMYLGRIVEIAPAHELYAAPKHPYTQALLSAVPIPDPSARRARIRVEGDVPNPIDPPTGCHFHPRCPMAMPICATQVPVPKRLSPGHSVVCHLYGSV